MSLFVYCVAITWRLEGSGDFYFIFTAICDGTGGALGFFGYLISSASLSLITLCAVCGRFFVNSFVLGGSLRGGFSTDPSLCFEIDLSFLTTILVIFSSTIKLFYFTRSFFVKSLELERGFVV